MSAIRSPVYGPFEVIGELSPEGREVLSLPFSEVAGCKVMVSVADNYALFPFAGFSPARFYPGVEVAIWGAVQGLQNCLRRVAVHMLSGPIAHTFDYADGWDTISFRGRNMCGGSTVNGDAAPPFPTQANGFSLKVSIYIMPRSGFASPGGEPQHYGKAG
jgi:hypothetical protein